MDVRNFKIKWLNSTGKRKRSAAGCYHTESGPISCKSSTSYVTKNKLIEYLELILNYVSRNWWYKIKSQTFNELSHEFDKNNIHSRISKLYTFNYSDMHVCELLFCNVTDIWFMRIQFIPWVWDIYIKYDQSFCRLIFHSIHFYSETGFVPNTLCC